MKNHHVQWVNQLFLWPFSIATLNYLVPMFWISPVSFPWFSLPSRPLWMSSAGAWQVLPRRMGCNDTKGMDDCDDDEDDAGNVDGGADGDADGDGDDGMYMYTSIHVCMCMYIIYIYMCVCYMWQVKCESHWMSQKKTSGWPEICPLICVPRVWEVCILTHRQEAVPKGWCRKRETSY